MKHLCIPALTVPRGFSGAELGLCGAAGAIELALLGLGPPVGAGECGLLGDGDLCRVQVEHGISSSSLCKWEEKP